MRNKTLTMMAQAKQISVYFLVCTVVVLIPVVSIAQFAHQFLFSPAVAPKSTRQLGLQR